MKIKYFLAGVAALFSTVASVSAQQINPVTQAMLDGYGRLLQENPTDYFTLYERSTQYFRLSMYDRAQEDILRAIDCTPAGEKGQLAAEYELAAEIYIQKKGYAMALEMSDKALEAQPNSYPLLYQKGNICLYLKKPEEAKRCFMAMQRLKSRSQEALFGLANASILQGDLSEARTYMDQAEKLDPSNYITYCRLGDLYTAMGEPQNAAANYLSAFSLASGKDRPLNSLLNLATTDYDAVAEALDYALEKTTNTVPLLFLRGNIAKENGRNAEAYRFYKKLLSTSEGNDPIVLSSLAEMALTANNLNEALGFAERAVSASSTPRNLLMKAKVEYALKDYNLATIITGSLLNKSADDYETLRIAALSNIAKGDYSEALNSLNIAILNDPEAIEALMLRAYVHSEMSNLSAQKADYERINRISPDSSYETALKAISQTLSGKMLDADTTIDSIKKKSEIIPDAAYYMALFYAQTGDKEKGIDCLNKARSLGFDNFYLLDQFDAPAISVAPLR